MSAAKLSRRERQILDVLYRRERASASEVMEDLPDAPTYSAVRGLLRVMVAKNLIVFENDGTRHVYAPAQPRPAAAMSALRQVVQTFFGGSAEQAVTTLLSAEETRLSEAELARLAFLIEQAQARDTAEETDRKTDSL